MKTSRDNFFGSASLVLEDYFGIKIPTEKLAAIVGDKMDAEWMDYEYRKVSPCMDTSPRDELIDIVSMYYMGRDWPSYGEKLDIPEFLRELKNQMDGENK